MRMRMAVRVCGCVRVCKTRVSVRGETNDDGGVHARVSVRARVDDTRVAHDSRIRIGRT